MIINLTGHDCTGKTTLAERLTNEINAEYTHFSNPKDMEDGKKQYFDFLNNVDSSKNYVCDRFHDGEWVYAPIYRGYTANYMEELESKLRKTDKYMLAYITADLETIIERIKVRGEDFVKEEHYQLVLDNFKNNFLMNQQMPFVMINTTHGTVDSNYELLKTSYEKVKLILDEQIELGVEVMPRGNINGSVMIVGNSESNPIMDEKMNYEYVSSLKESGIYLDCWFSYVCSKNMESILNQINIVKPKTIIAIDPVSYSFIRQRLTAGKDRVILLDSENNHGDLTELFKMVKNMK